ncbi:MAG: ubiquinol-cytochrome c reductase iron-sulfur subunit [Gemmatimonadetes bacterium]|nr:ubiquinol-cytochrome c reductase iron-sulfur subunit [Gemmatimonadota bacterium]
MNKKVEHVAKNGASDSEEEILRELLEVDTPRRRALEVIIGGALAALGVGMAIPVVGYVRAPERTGEHGGTRVQVAELAELPPGSALKVALDDRPVLVLNVDGEVRAFSAICTHLGCIVLWDDTGQFIHCPCHDGRFDTNGQVISGPPPAPLPAIPVAVEDGRVYLGRA